MNQGADIELVSAIGHQVTERQFALGRERQNEALGLCLFPSSRALLRLLVADILLLLAGRNAALSNISPWRIRMSELRTSDERYVQVSDQTFWEAIKKLNVHPRPVGTYPYRSDFVTPDGSVMGRMIPSDTHDGEPHSYVMDRSLIK